MTFSSNFDLDNAPQSVLDNPLDSRCESGAQASVTEAIDQKPVIARNRSMVVFAIACFVVAVLIASSVSGQEARKKYDSIKINPKIDTAAGVRTMKAEARNFSSTGRGNGRAVQAYFGQYVPGKITAPDGEKHLSQIVADVNGFLERANKGGRPEIARGLSGLTFKSLSPVATGNYHPTARIAAVAIIAGLDSRPLDISNKKPPVPMADALPILISLYENEDNVDGLRAAALQGIQRHAMYSFATMPAETKTKLSSLMNDLLDADAPEGRDPAAHAFLQRYAVDVLDYIGGGKDASLGMKLVSISTEPKSLEMIALHSASRLATMSEVLENKIDNPKKVLHSWTARTLTAFENEIERIESMKRRGTTVRQPRDPSTHLRKPEEVKEGRRTTGGRGNSMSYEDEMGGGYTGGGGRESYDEMMDYGMGDEDMGGRGRRTRELPAVIQEAEIVASRRKLNHVLQQVHLGVTGSPTAGMPGGKAGGLLGMVDEATKKEIFEWTETMQDVLYDINDSQIAATSEFLIVLKTQIEPLQELVESIDHRGAEVKAPVLKEPAVDALEAELSEDKLLEADLMAEPVLQP